MHKSNNLTKAAHLFNNIIILLQAPHCFGVTNLDILLGGEPDESQIPSHIEEPVTPKGVYWATLRFYKRLNKPSKTIDNLPVVWEPK